ncbi:hypothetical protein LAZ67_19000799 [Cordylochernes scorpioides]|uniref:Protein kinase domain-containing protein n=1 Tax=Cordylochernes scorpioides TaxID=51811 RepID=A0ABY6LK57_9ARAC|nr:hypothetical protein LAZ67_19000799 [Cordylochernes scorpioides]
MEFLDDIEKTVPLVEEERENFEDILSECKISQLNTFKEVFGSKKLKRLGKGVSGSCYLDEANSVVYKIAPISQCAEVKTSQQQDFSVRDSDYYETLLEDFLTEWEVNQALQKLKSGRSNFCYVYEIGLIWDRKSEFRKFKNKFSSNIFKNVFKESRRKQMYAVLKMDYGGNTLHSQLKHLGSQQKQSVIVQVAVALACAEEQMDFKHGDLHTNNIVVSATDKKSISYNVEFQDFEVPTYGVMARIIDFGRSHFESVCKLTDDIEKTVPLVKKEREKFEDILSECKISQLNTFKEVFGSKKLKRLGKGVSGSCDLDEANSVVYKIAPISQCAEVKTSQQQDFSVRESDYYKTKLEDFLAEWEVNQALQNLKSGRYNFSYVYEIGLIWDRKSEFRKFKNKFSSNIFKKICKESRRKQMYAVFKMDYGGNTLHSQLNHLGSQQKQSVIVQVAVALACAEEQMDFRHGDLHTNNIVVSATDKKSISYNVKSQVFEVPTNGILARIIDFGRSQFKVKNNSSVCEYSQQPLLLVNASFRHRNELYLKCLFLVLNPPPTQNISNFTVAITDSYTFFSKLSF